MNNSSHNYEESELEYKNFLLPSLVSAFSFLDPRPGWKVLDAGCGPGSIFLPLLDQMQYRGHITGIDSSESHLQRAQLLIDENKLQENVSVFLYNLFEQLPFADNSFDLVWFSDCYSRMTPVKKSQTFYKRQKEF